MRLMFRAKIEPTDMTRPSKSICKGVKHITINDKGVHVVGAKNRSFYSNDEGVLKSVHKNGVGKGRR